MDGYETLVRIGLEDRTSTQHEIYAKSAILIEITSREFIQMYV